MKMARAEAQSLRQIIADGRAVLLGSRRERALCRSGRGTSLGGRLEELAGKSVLLATGSQLTTALALIELDGVARRLTILPPDADPDHFAALIAGADVDAVVVDRDPPAERCIRSSGSRRLQRRKSSRPNGFRAAIVRTEWVLLTSGTTGVPKMVGARTRRPDRAVSPERQPTAPSSGARFTTSAAMAACRYFCARCSAAFRSCSRAPANRSPIISSASPGTA